MGWVMFSIVQDISHIGQQGDWGLYFGPNSPQSPGDIVSFDFFSIANSFSWWYWKLVNCRKEHTKKHKYQKTQVPVVQVWKNLEIKNNRRQVRSSAGFGFPKSFELSVISHIQNMYVRSGLTPCPSLRSFSKSSAWKNLLRSKSSKLVPRKTFRKSSLPREGSCRNYIRILNVW